MIKVIIANNNDILYNSLSSISLQNKLEIEITKIPQDQLAKLIYQVKSKDNLIILDSITSITFCTNVLKNAIEQIDTKRENIIILVIDSNSISNIKYKEYHHFFKKKDTTSVLDIVKIVSNSIKDSINLEKTIDDIFWQLGFTFHFKGTLYLKDAIMFAYIDKTLSLDIKLLIKKVAKKHNVTDESLVRSNIDKSLNIALDDIDTDTIYEVFGNDYDGRKISFKYFLNLCIRYLEKQRSCCLEQ